MGGIEGLSRRVCAKLANPDKYIEKTALQVEKLSRDSVSQKDLEKARRKLSAAQYSYGVADIMLRKQEENARMLKEIEKLR